MIAITTNNIIVIGLIAGSFDVWDMWQLHWWYHRPCAAWRWFSQVLAHSLWAASSIRILFSVIIQTQRSSELRRWTKKQHANKDKLSEVADFATPQGAKALRIFLGLTQYFSTHVPHYATLERPLRDVLIKHDKTRKFVWTVEAQDAFLALQTAVCNCP